MTEREEPWTQARIERLIADGTEESVTLEYKAARALGKNNDKKKEISKDVSALANSGGGILIYGVSEYQDDARSHLPEKIDPIDRTEFSKEWLEQVILSNIQPKIEGIIIHPVSIDSAPHHVVYVVEVPQSETAHQARDKRYYKRFNFESVPMEDYEIRDVMGRQQHPRIEPEFELHIETKTESSDFDTFSYRSPLEKPPEPKVYTVYKLKIRLANWGKVVAKHVAVFIDLPGTLRYEYSFLRGTDPDAAQKINIDTYVTINRYNTTRDLIKGGGAWGRPPEYGPERNIPILPGISIPVDSIRLTDDFEQTDWGERSIKWTTHADNAPPHSGEIAIKDIKIIDHRNIPDNAEDQD